MRCPARHFAMARGNSTAALGSGGLALGVRLGVRIQDVERRAVARGLHDAHVLALQVAKSGAYSRPRRWTASQSSFVNCQPPIAVFTPTGLPVRSRTRAILSSSWSTLATSR